jgi:hypothetical protein
MVPFIRAAMKVSDFEPELPFEVSELRVPAFA